MVKIDNAVKVVKIYDDNHRIIGNKKIDDTLKTPESYRTIPLRKEYEEILKNFKETEKKRLGKAFREDNYVFLNRNGDPYTPEILTNKMPGFTEKWGLPHITPYGLRHSFASLMAKLGVKETVLKVMMGHKDISTTHRYYIHLTDEDVMEEIMTVVADKNKSQTIDNTNDVLMEKMDELMKMMRNNSMQNNRFITRIA